jgi:hypothetical protein
MSFAGSMFECVCSLEGCVLAFLLGLLDVLEVDFGDAARHVVCQVACDLLARLANREHRVSVGTEEDGSPVNIRVELGSLLHTARLHDFEVVPGSNVASHASAVFLAVALAAEEGRNLLVWHVLKQRCLEASTDDLDLVTSFLVDEAFDD